MASTTTPATSNELLARMVHQAAGRFPEYKEGVGGIAPFADGDEFNARLMSSHPLVGAEALTDEQVRANGGWVISVVAGNSDGRYEEHATELGLE